MRYGIVFVFMLHLFSGLQCARILGLWVLAGPSHYILGNSLMKGLAEAGHDVTLISPFEDKVPPKRGSYRNIVLTGFVEKFIENTSSSHLFQFSMTNNPLTPIFLTQFVGPVVDEAIAHPNVQKLLKSGEKFDAVIIEQFSNDALKAFANHFDSHLIVFSSLFASSMVNRMVGNPFPISYIPDLATSFFPKMIFFERTLNTLIYSIRKLLTISFAMPAQEKLRKKYFPEGPTVYESYTNASLILLNGHESLNQPVPLVPNMIPIGGYHIKPPKKLPQDLQKILDEAKEGVVYVSMGSNLKSKDMPAEKRNIILKSLGKLKEKVLWKWEDEKLPGKPNNVETRKWFPQSDILAHPNVKLFVTHGGLLSTMETIYHGKPILAIPVFGDQITNANMAEHAGYARMLSFHDPDWSQDRLYSLIKEMLDSPKYQVQAQLMSKLFHDRPMKPMDVATYWVEYVIRNKGATHLRVLGTEFPWWKYYLLDVILFLICSCLVSIFIACKLIGKIIKCCKRNDKIKVKKS